MMVQCRIQINVFGVHKQPLICKTYRYVYYMLCCVNSRDEGNCEMSTFDSRTHGVEAWCHDI